MKLLGEKTRRDHRAMASIGVVFPQASEKNIRNMA
jgi:hypothetical protein